MFQVAFLNEGIFEDLATAMVSISIGLGDVLWNRSLRMVDDLFPSLRVQAPK